MPENITLIAEIYQVWGPEAISHIKCTVEILERVVPVMITKIKILGCVIHSILEISGVNGSNLNYNF